MFKPRTPKFTPVDLGPSLSGEATVRKVNDRGSILVAYREKPEASFLWAGGRRTPLPKGFYALDLGGRGEVAGYVATAGGTRAAVWSGGRIAYPLPEPGDAKARTEARLVNDGGALLIRENEEEHFLLRDGARTPVPTLGTPVAMNNAGAVLWDDNSTQGVVWKAGAQIKIPGLDGQDWTLVKGMNGAGVVCGYTQSGGPGWINAFRSVGGKVEKLTRPPYDGPNLGKDTWYGGAALAIADSGDIVGYGSREVWNFASLPDRAPRHGGECGLAGPNRDQTAVLWRAGTVRPEPLPDPARRVVSRIGGFRQQPGADTGGRLGGQIAPPGSAEPGRRAGQVTVAKRGTPFQR
jgi:hypothetical protein